MICSGKSWMLLKPYFSSFHLCQTQPLTTDLLLLSIWGSEWYFSLRFHLCKNQNNQHSPSGSQWNLVSSEFNVQFTANQSQSEHLRRTDSHFGVRVLHVSAWQLLCYEKITVHRAGAQIKLAWNIVKFAMAKEIRFFRKSKSTLSWDALCICRDFVQASWEN